VKFDLKSIVEKCIKCNYCFVCPVYKIEGWESVSPRGKLILLKELSEGRIKIDKKIVEDFYKCSTCGLCEVVCVLNLPLVNLWEFVRAKFVKMGYAPLNRHKRVRNLTYKEFNPYGGSKHERSKWLNVKPNEKSKVLYFAGCTSSFRLQNLAKNSAELLIKIGVDFNYAGNDEVCCGSPFIRTGQLDLAGMLFEKNYKTWKRLGIKTIVTSCPGCYRTIAKDYPRFARERGWDFDFEVYHIVSLIDKYVGNFDEEIKISATYHDPCHLGRHMGIYEEPRRVIRKLGIKLIEMERNKEYSFCCGAGGGLRTQFGDISFKIGEERIREAIKTNVDYLITACPFCEFHLSKSSKRLKSNIKVLDVVELANKALK